MEPSIECDEHSFGEWSDWVHVPGSNSVSRTRQCSACGLIEGVAQAVFEADNTEDAVKVDGKKVLVAGGTGQSLVDALDELAG